MAMGFFKVYPIPQIINQLMKKLDANGGTYNITLGFFLCHRPAPDIFSTRL
jgi:hypothetical protein